MHNVENVRCVGETWQVKLVCGIFGGERVSEPTFDHSAEVCLTVCPFVRVSVCPEHNGNVWRKKHVVELLRMLNIRR